MADDAVNTAMKVQAVTRWNQVAATQLAMDERSDLEGITKNDANDQANKPGNRQGGANPLGPTAVAVDVRVER